MLKRISIMSWLVVFTVCSLMTSFAGAQDAMFDVENMRPQDRARKSYPMLFDEWESLTKEDWLTEDQIPAASIIGLTEFTEAPMLAKKVAAGELPPVAERLPRDPVVVNVVEEIGEYGGTMDRVTGAGMHTMHLITRRGYDFFKWDRSSISYLGPNMMKDWEWSDDLTTITFFMVEGIKWSNGDPLTVDDIIFWWEDIINYDGLPYNPPNGTHIAGEPVTMTKIDDYTIEFTYPKPFPYAQFSFNDSFKWIVPSTYLKQFHPKYNTELVENEAVQELQVLIDDVEITENYPTYSPWILVKHEDGVRSEYERNPYYWKVDAEGQQLPYIDRIVMRTVESRELAVLQAIEGKIDFQAKDWAVSDLPLLMENQESGGYRVIFWEFGEQSRPKLIPGYDYPDDAVRAINFDQRFRQALSYAIDRDQLNEIVFLGLCQPKAGVMTKQWMIYNYPEGKEAYDYWEGAEWKAYDPEKAQALLDDMGMVDTDGDGFRERPDGEKFEYIVDMGTKMETADAMDLIRQNWEDIGIKTILNSIAGPALQDKVKRGETMMFARDGGAGSGVPIAPAGWLPIAFNARAIHPLAGQYYETNGAKGIPPRTEVFQKLQDLYTKAITSVDEAERVAAEVELIRMQRDDGPIIIATVGNTISPVIAKSTMRNIPEWSMHSSWFWNSPSITGVDQYFFEGGEAGDTNNN